jgi:hypothetical protein
MVLEEDEDGPQRERRQQRTNVLAAGLHKAAAKGDWAAVRRTVLQIHITSKLDHRRAV